MSAACGHAVQGPLMRRYWLCGGAALDALDGAIDPPDWQEAAIATTIVCLDQSALDICRPFARGVETHVVDALDRSDFVGLVARLIASDHARYIQLCLSAVQDFEPAVELIRERLENDARSILRGRVVHVGPTGTWFGAADRLCRSPQDAAVRAALAPEGVWIEADLLRRALSDQPLPEASPAALADLMLRVARSAEDIVELPLVLAARFSVSPEGAALESLVLDALQSGAVAAVRAAVRADAAARYVIDNLALDNGEVLRRLEADPTPPSEWRARAAAALARVDRLEVEARHFWIQENARKRKSLRDEERRRADLAAELARPRSEPPSRGRIGKALRRWR